MDVCCCRCILYAHAIGTLFLKVDAGRISGRMRVFTTPYIQYAACMDGPEAGGIDVRGTVSAKANVPAVTVRY